MRRLVAFFVAATVIVLFPFAVLADSPADPTSGDSLVKNLPTPEQWQAWCIAFGPLVIACAMRVFASVFHTPNKEQRKIVANVIILVATLVGLYLDHKLDDFTPTVAGLIYMFALVHQSYDKLWQGIPGLNDIIYAIDPWSGDAPQRTSHK